nr:tetratricopeptide repeat protein [Anaerolineae bacterium]
MINLPPKLTPSELLCCDGLPRSIDELLRGSRSLRREGGLPEAERCALAALEASQAPVTYVSQAAALIHLADVHRDMGKLGSALADCQKAYRIFQRQPSPYQRHNEAVAAYALGLQHQLLSNWTNALKWYHESSELFERVKEDWTAVNALAWLDSCTRVQRLMEMVGEYLTAALTDREMDFSTRIWVPIILLQKDRSVVEQLAIEESDHELTAELRPFQVCPFEEGWSISLTPGVEYEGREIPDKVRGPMGAGEGDHALVEWGKIPANPDNLERLNDLEGGDFGRDIDGKIYAIRPVRRRMIGGEEIVEDQIGPITALLKPAPSPPGVAPPPEPPAPPPEPSADPTEAYSELVRMVGG